MSGRVSDERVAELHANAAQAAAVDVWETPRVTCVRTAELLALLDEVRDSRASTGGSQQRRNNK